MALIISVHDILPQFGADCFLAENATVIGDVVMGDSCSVWFHTVVRGDVNRIRIGNKVNVQDGTVIHCTYQKTQTIIGNNVSIGHNAIVHGCVIGDNVLIGMGAIIMDGAVIGKGSIIAAGAVVIGGTRVEEGSIYAGIPAVKIKELSPQMRDKGINRIAENYVKYASWYRRKKES